MRLAHVLDLRRAKGRPPSSLSIFAYSNSLAMVISPSDLAHLGLKSRDLGVTLVARALLQRTLSPAKGPVTPFRKPVHRDAKLPRYGLQALAPEKPLNRAQFPLRRKAPDWTGHGPATAPPSPASWARADEAVASVSPEVSSIFLSMLYSPS